MKRMHNKQNGVALVAAIFVLVVFSFLAVMGLGIAQIGRSTSLFALQGARAYYSAKAGLEWAGYELSAGSDPLAICALSPATTSTQFALNQFTVTTQCSYTQHFEQGDCYNVYQVASTAAYSARPTPPPVPTDNDYVSRRVSATMTLGCP